MIVCEYIVDNICMVVTSIKQDRRRRCWDVIDDEIDAASPWPSKNNRNSSTLFFFLLLCVCMYMYTARERVSRASTHMCWAGGRAHGRAIDLPTIERFSKSSRHVQHDASNHVAIYPVHTHAHTKNWFNKTSTTFIRLAYMLYVPAVIDMPSIVWIL